MSSAAMSAIAIVISYWIKDTLSERRRIKLQEMICHKHDNIMLESLSWKRYHQQRNEVTDDDIFTHVYSMMERNVPLQPCFVCDNTRHLEIRETIEHEYHFKVTASCKTEFCPNFSIYIF